MSNNVKKDTQKVVVITWDKVMSLTKKLAKDIADAKFHPQFVFGIPKGGLVPAALLVRELSALGIETEIVDHSMLNLSDDYYKSIVIDEIVDSGDTIKDYTNMNGIMTVALFQRSTTHTSARLVGELIDNPDWLSFPWERYETA